MSEKNTTTCHSSDELKKTAKAEADRIILADTKAILEMGKKQLKQEKFEEIKKRAWELFCSSASDRPDDHACSFAPFEFCWEKAEEFYEFAKQKQEEKESES